MLKKNSLHSLRNTQGLHLFRVTEQCQAALVCIQSMRLWMRCQHDSFLHVRFAQCSAVGLLQVEIGQAVVDQIDGLLAMPKDPVSPFKCARIQPPAELVEEMRTLAQTTGARISIEIDPLKAVVGADFIYTDVWVSMGEPDDVWKQRIDQLLPYQVNKALMQATGKARTRFMHCLPAFHNLDTEVGRHVHERFGLSEIEVTDEVFESDASIVFTQAENRMHTIKAVLVATLA